jgi:hypothetical protein
MVFHFEHDGQRTKYFLGSPSEAGFTSDIRLATRSFWTSARFISASEEQFQQWNRIMTWRADFASSMDVAPAVSLRRNHWHAAGDCTSRNAEMLPRDARFPREPAGGRSGCGEQACQGAGAVADAVLAGGGGGELFRAAMFLLATLLNK